MYHIEHQQTLVLDSFQSIIRTLCLEDRLNHANYVVIKPNFSSAAIIPFESHAVTDLSLLGTIIDGIVSIKPNMKIYIAESDNIGYGYAFLKFEHFKSENEYCSIIDRFGADKICLLDLSRDRLERVHNDSLRYFKSNLKQLWISSILKNADFVISLTNLKTHPITKLSGSCKNMFGVLPEHEKWIYHNHLDDVIHDIILAVPPTLSIVDAFRGMEGNGPVFGLEFNEGFRVWADHPVLADAASCKLVGMNWKKIGHLNVIAKSFDIIQTIACVDTLDARRIVCKPQFVLRICIKFGLAILSMGELLTSIGLRFINRR